MQPSVTSAYNPPVDQVGPLTVRIIAPETVARTETPIGVKVELKNDSNQPVSGQVRLGVIDRWRCEPADAAAFTVAGNTTKTVDFRVIAGAGTYSAHYPIHAFANFAWQGKQQTAHPIRILETKLPVVNRGATRLPFQPLPIAADRRVMLRHVPVHRTVINVFDQPPEVMPTGFHGSHEENRCSVDLQRSIELDGDTRSAIAIHPPWYNGQVGTALVEFPVALPDVHPVTLTFATAVTPTGTGDGVTFRVRVAAADAPAGRLGEVVFERHSAAKTWEAGEADLSRFAGQTIRLQLESHPGPKKNTSFDQSYWAEPTLIVGTPAAPRPFPPASTENSRLLGKIDCGSTEYDVRLWLGQRGLLDAAVGFLAADRQLYFRGFRVRVMGERIDDPASPSTLVAVEPGTCQGNLQLRHCFDGIRGKFTLIGRIGVRDGALRVKFLLVDAPAQQSWFAPRIEELAVEEFHVAADRVYAGHGNVIQDPQIFRLGFDGHRLATSHVGFDFPDGVSLLQAVHQSPDSLEVNPARRHYSMHAVGDASFTLIPADSVWQAVKRYREINGLKAAGGVERLAGRFVFDLWGGRYGESSAQLRRAFRYGLTDAAVVWHNWQRWGYDYRLPEIYPPNPHWGTEEELKHTIDICRSADVLFALHDNYIDMYPDVEGFSYEKNIAFHVNGTPVKAWLNKGRDARSYRYRADRIDPFLKPNLQLIAERLQPTAYFIDVWSSIRPYDYWTADGRFFDRRLTRATWGEHFAWIRELQGNNAPQISESGHDQLIGWLDGAQTNHLRVGRPLPGDRGWCVWDIRCQDAERTPWFDAAHHDRFVLHGAGYSSRYEAGLDSRLHGMYSDDYIATEVLTGHPSMVNRPFGRHVVRKYWLTRDLMRALALRTIEDVEFVGGDLHRQFVRWSGGGQVWVNRGDTDWAVGDVTLPPYGFLAQVPTAAGMIEASVFRSNGVLVERAVSPAHVYVNARQIVGGPAAICATAENVQFTSPNRLTFSLVWQFDEPAPEGYRPFIHFVDDEGEILFQSNYDHTLLADRRTGRIAMPCTAYVPLACRPGEKLELRIGFYSPSRGGPRLALTGADDGERRYRLGTVEFAGEGSRIAGIRWTPLRVGPDRYLARQNAAALPIDFGLVVTAGGCRISRSDESVILTPLPKSATVRSVFEVRWDKLPWNLPRPTHVRMLAEDGKVVGREALGETIRIECGPDVIEYKLTAGDGNGEAP
jgi:hypothetical protein